MSGKGKATVTKTRQSIGLCFVMKEACCPIQTLLCETKYVKPLNIVDAIAAKSLQDDKRIYTATYTSKDMCLGRLVKMSAIFFVLKFLF